MKTVSNAGYLTVRFDAPSGRRWGGEVAIEVRDPKTFVVRARGMAGTPLTVPEGKHWVGAILPNGEQVSIEDSVNIKPGEKTELNLPWPESDVPATLEQSAWVPRSVRAAADFVAPAWQLLTRVSAARLHGNWLAARLRLGPPPERQRISNLTMQATLSDLPMLLEISSGADNPTYFAIPVDGNGARTTANWAFDAASQQVKMRFDFHDGELNTFFDYVQEGFAQEARSISRTLVGQAETYLYQRKSGLRAALAIYVLLRANETEGLDEWSKRLCTDFEWLPDGVALRIEYLAREGRHTEAADLIPMLAHRGAPWFRSGVAYVASRAKLYSTLLRSATPELSVAAETRPLLDQMAAEMDALTNSLDLGEMISVFRELPPPR